jgi:hypothetical protein
VSRDILSMLPDELRNLHFEEELDRLSRDIRIEQIRGQLSVLKERKRLALPARTAVPPKAKASSASGSRIYRGDPQRTRR